MATPKPDPVIRAWGRMLRDRRKALGITVTAAAEAAGMTRQTWQRIEKGAPGVALGLELAAARVLGMRMVLDVAPEEGVDTRPRHGARALPLEIRLADYPGLQRLAWQLRKGVQTLTPRQAWELYERNGRHLQRGELTPHEEQLMRDLRTVLGGANGDV